MTGARYPIAERGDEGTHDRRQCLFELDQLLNQGSPPPAASAAFVARWGEGLRAILGDEDGLFSDYDNSDYC